MGIDVGDDSGFNVGTNRRITVPVQTGIPKQGNTELKERNIAFLQDRLVTERYGQQLMGFIDVFAARYEGEDRTAFAPP